MSRKFILPIVGDNPVDDLMEEMYESITYVPSQDISMQLYEPSVNYLDKYLFVDPNDVCRGNKVGYIPNINDDIINNNLDKSIVQLFELEKMKHKFDFNLDEYMEDNLDYKQKKNKISEERTAIIKKMYEYKATVAKDTTVKSTGEIIGNWYMLGFPVIEDLEKIFDIEDVYDMDILCRVKVADIDETAYLNDGQVYLKMIEYFKRYIDLYGSERLEDEEYCIGLMIVVLIDMDWDKQQGYDMYSLIVHRVNSGIYMAVALEFYNKVYQEVIMILRDNYKNEKTDDTLGITDLNSKKEALNLSLRMVKNILKIDDSLKIEFDEIFENLEHRINTNKQVLSTFVRTMKSADMNYILSTNSGDLFYPYFVDLILDIYRFKYMVKENQENIDMLKKSTSVFKGSEYETEFHSVRTSYLFNKIQILDKINRNQIENYLLHLYTKECPSNPIAVKSFYKQILFSSAIMKVKSKTFSSELNLKNVPTNISIRYYSRLIK